MVCVPYKIDQILDLHEFVYIHDNKFFFLQLLYMNKNDMFRNSPSLCIGALLGSKCKFQ